MIVSPIFPRGSDAFDAPRNSRRTDPAGRSGAFYSRGLSENESRCLATLAMYYAVESRRPTYAEIAISIGVSSRNTAEKIVRSLERKGFLERQHPAPRVHLRKQHQASP